MNQQNILHIFSKFVIGETNFTIKSNIPEVLNTPTATNIPINVGNSLNTIFIPSFAPSKKISYTFFFSNNPYMIIINITIGIADADK